MKYEILTVNAEYELFIVESESADFIANQILQKVNEFVSNYVKVSFVDVRGTSEDIAEFKKDILECLEELLNKDKCHLGNFVKLEVEEECDGSVEYAEYGLISKAGRGCSLTLEIL